MTTWASEVTVLSDAADENCRYPGTCKDCGLSDEPVEGGGRCKYCYILWRLHGLIGLN